MLRGDKHYLIFATTGAGKTTFLNSLMIENVRDNRGDPLFRCHVFPDFDSIDLYKKLGIPIYKSVEEVYEAYVHMKISHCAFNPDLEIYSGVDPKQEVLLLLASVFNEKYELMKDAQYDTHTFILFIDEIQKIMTKQDLDPVLREVFTEGRKYKLYIYGFTQDLALINNVTIRQSYRGYGYIDFDTYYSGRYKIVFPDKKYTIWLQIEEENKDVNVYEFVSQKTTLKAIKNEFHLYKKREVKKPFYQRLYQGLLK